MNFEETFGTAKPVIGVIHLLPLPGSSRWGGELEEVLSRAEQEAAALSSGGVDGIIVENFFDAPFAKDSVDVATACAMTLAVKRIIAVCELPVGVNVLRNDGMTALAVAASSGAQFVRVNVLSGAMVTDQGIIEGDARALHLYRRQLMAQSTCQIFADVMVKHAYPLGAGSDIGSAAKDTVHRALADALIVSGEATGSAPCLEDLQKVRRAVPDSSILVGSGATVDNVAELLQVADGIIVASSLKRKGILSNPVDVERVRVFVEAARQAAQV